jgi:hypothetical protein
MESIDKFYMENPEAPAITTSGQVWRGGGAPVMEYGNRNGFWLHKTFHMTTFHLIT